MRLLRLSLTFATLTALSCAAIPTADGAEASPKKAASRPAKKANPNLLTREQLRACMDKEERLQRTRVDIQRQETALEQPRADVERIDAEIARRIAALDPADEAARQSLRDEEARRNQIADDYNAQLRALRERASAYESDRKQWLDQCANKDFDEMDEAAIKLEKRRAAGRK